MTTTRRWLELDGTVNARDLGGLPTVDGRVTAASRLIRSDNLQDLSESDVRLLVDEIGVRAVADLRTGVEVTSEGPGPLTREPLVRIEHLSLFPESGRNTDATRLDEGPDAPVILPWQTAEIDRTDPNRVPGAAGVYVGYLMQRPDSVIDALRLVAYTDGATIVHCAAGKDRTGVLVALALAEVGVAREAIVADYVQTAERIEAILRRLMATRTYAGDVSMEKIDKHTPQERTMRTVLATIDDRFGGVGGWLAGHGWTDADHAALETRLLA
jgi:protein tyrosine/serine phosphatase